MLRRPFLLSLLCLPALARASLLDAISGKDASTGLRQALEQGASQAVAQLGAQDGFLGSERFRIPLPEALQQAEPILRTLGQGKAMDELHVAMNRAAELAVSEAKPLLVNAVRQMTVSDAKQIISGGDDSVTQYFRSKTEQPLGQKFLPIVQRATARFQLAEHYNRLAGKGVAFGLVKAEDAQVERYVTRKALDALYLRIGEEERAIRENPSQAIGSIAKKVFGALGER